MRDTLLLVTDPDYGANPFGDYLGEILKTEGFLGVRQTPLAKIDPVLLRRFATVILTESRPTSERGQVLREFVANGGRLLAMRPNVALADLFGLTHTGARRERLLQYVSVDPLSEIARGIETSTLQYHGEADEYLLTSASAVAWLCDAEGGASSHPAVSVNSYGRGLTVAFAYDLARSVALARQGNPDWACTDEYCEDGDGFEGIRPVDAFLRQTGEKWVDLARIPIQQADEQQRLFANCLMFLSQDLLPLPRLWYLPDGKSAAVVMTSDGDDSGFEDFEPLLQAAEECGGRFSAYILRLEGDPNRPQVQDWLARGHEVSIHTDFEGIRERPTMERFSEAYARNVQLFKTLYGTDPGPSVRHHWLIWYGWADSAEIEREHGIHLDFNYYHGRQWILPDGRWTQGYYTGSGLPQRFVRQDGRILDIFQMLTTWADETQLWRQGQSVEAATEVVRSMLDWAEGGRYSYFVSNFHPRAWKKRNTETWAHNMMAEAVSRDLPIWSGGQMYSFISARDGARLENLDWDGARLSFDLETAAPASGSITLMLPASFAGRPILGISQDDRPSAVEVKTIAGHDYVFLPKSPGRRNITAIYAP